MEKKIKIIFIGTPEFGVLALKSLISDKFFYISSVITQGDKKVGRKHIITFPPIKTEALKHNISVFQPEKIKNFTKKIKKMAPDLIIVIAYSQIIPEDILKIPKYGCINVHGSLLPKYRGAACIQASIINGDKESGITIMKMDKGLDTGPILHKEKVELDNEETAGSLSIKLSLLAGKTLVPVLKKYIEKKIKPRNQDDNKSSYVGKLSKKDGEINWHDEAEKLEKIIRAMNPWPGAWTKYDSYIIKIKKAEILKTDYAYKVGQTFLYNNELAIKCGSDALILKIIQLEGKKETSSKDFIKGNNYIIGAFFHK